MSLDFDELYPGKFLKAAEFKGSDVTYTMKAIHLEELEGKKGTETKGIVSFHETKKQLALNKTNGLCLKAMFGRDTGQWVGKRVTFYPAPIDFEDVEICIRVRGSPDIAADMDAEIKLPRKKPRTMRLVRTGNGKGKGAGKAAAPKAPDVWEQMEIAADEYGIDRKRLGPILQTFCKKTKRAELDEGDLAEMKTRLAAAREAADKVAASVGFQQPAAEPQQDDIPF